MKKLIYLSLAMLLATSLACSKGGDSDPLNDPPTNNPDSGPDTDPDTPEPSAVSYQADIAPIISSNCTTCHGDPPTQNAPMSLLTLEQVRSAVENRGLLGRINSTSDPMPPTGRLPQSTRDLIEEWVNQGFPE
ncbi:hypothetical protein [Robiginitalea sp. SC105]|uniref:hypothetical protein n=1 Tax=Robiginitalea sp. SC105 TaxID=2762332 RepID=UPI001639705C|nr:hypothetical protein [Robiginitalea sp. SC105]MBC2839448.1 hypothetical protein [Robiginitalea sp. SC105]